MDLSTRYLGLSLAHPIMPGASPLVDSIDTVRRLEDGGAAAIVMHSLFEEQIDAEDRHAAWHLDAHGESYAEALSYFPAPDAFALGPDEYLEQIRRIKAVVSVPVIASLNGATRGGWLEYGQWIEEAGADALELNVYELATDPEESGEDVERRVVEVLAALKGTLHVPVAVKLSPFYSSLAHFARRLDAAGADGLVLFNRFYQSDIDVESLEVVRSIRLSDPSELLLRLRWLAILSGRVRGSLAVTGGVHGPLDAIKAIMSGAHAVQVVSALLKRGPTHIRSMLSDVARWLEEREYDSLGQMRGSMDLSRCPDPRAYERANYMHVLQSFRPTTL